VLVSVQGELPSLGHPLFVFNKFFNRLVVNQQRVQILESMGLNRNQSLVLMPERIEREHFGSDELEHPILRSRSEQSPVARVTYHAMDFLPIQRNHSAACRRAMLELNCVLSTLDSKLPYDAAANLLHFRRHLCFLSSGVL
jgi:hypothetical protein